MCWQCRFTIRLLKGHLIFSASAFAATWTAGFCVLAGGTIANVGMRDLLGVPCFPRNPWLAPFCYAKTIDVVILYLIIR